jgi:hypothetical protein
MYYLPGVFIFSTSAFPSFSQVHTDSEIFLHRDDTGRDTIPQRWSINILSYQKTVEYFSTRAITYHGDVLNAFEGMAQRMRPLFRSEFVYGLPLSELDYCLLWEPSGKICRRRDPDTGSTLFPSWSWAGWVGPIRYNWEERLGRVKWVDAFDRKFTSDEYRAPNSHGDTTVQAWRKEWTEKKTTRSDFRYFYHSSDPDAWFRNPVAPEAERNHKFGPHCLSKTGQLRFWAWAMDLTLPKEWQTPVETTGSWCQFPFADKKGYTMGYFRVPVEILPTMDHTKLYDLVVIVRTRHYLTRKEAKDTKMPPEPDKTSTLSAEESAKHEKSPSKKPLENYDDDKDVTLEENFFPDEPQMENGKWDLGFDRQRFDAYKAFCLYELLLVEWIDGVAYRIGTGKAHIDAWAREDPKWKLITLG